MLLDPFWTVDVIAMLVVVVAVVVVLDATNGWSMDHSIALSALKDHECKDSR